MCGSGEVQTSDPGPLIFIFIFIFIVMRDSKVSPKLVVSVAAKRATATDHSNTSLVSASLIQQSFFLKKKAGALLNYIKRKQKKSYSR